MSPLASQVRTLGGTQNGAWASVGACQRALSLPHVQSEVLPGLFVRPVPDLSRRRGDIGLSLRPKAQGEAEQHTQPVGCVQGASAVHPAQHGASGEAQEAIVAATGAGSGLAEEGKAAGIQTRARAARGGLRAVCGVEHGLARYRSHSHRIWPTRGLSITGSVAQGEARGVP